MHGEKDKLQSREIPGVVYAVGCKECKMVYVGEAKRTANQRIREHKADTRNGHVDKSAIAELAHMTGYEVHWDAIVIEREQGTRRRKIKEAWHIQHMTKKGGSMNQDCSVSRIWLDLVE